MREKEARLQERRARQEEQRLAHLRTKFDAFDTAQEGSVGQERVYDAFIEMEMKVDKYEVKQLFKQFDQDGSGTIDFGEFAEMVQMLNRKRFKAVFAQFDVDGSGELDPEEVQAAFALLGFEFSPETVAAMIQDYDVSGDGLVQFDEFCERLEGTLIQREEEVSLLPPHSPAFPIAAMQRVSFSETFLTVVVGRAFVSSLLAVVIKRTPLAGIRGRRCQRVAVGRSLGSRGRAGAGGG